MSDEGMNILMDGDEVQPVSLDEFVDAVDKSNKFHAMKLKWGMALKEQFMDYLHNPTVEVECYYDRDLDTYFYAVKPYEGSDLQDMINERLGIKPID